MSPCPSAFRRRARLHDCLQHKRVERIAFQIERLYLPADFFDHVVMGSGMARSSVALT